MAYFIIEQPGIPRIIAQVKEKETTFGRAEDNVIVLIADEVSRRHAKLIRQGQHYILIDLNSLNGTYVNGQRISERVLSDGDEIWMGSKCKLIFRDEALGPPEALANLRGQEYISSEIDVDSIRTNWEHLNTQLSFLGQKHSRPISIESEDAPKIEELLRAYARLVSLYKASTEVGKLIASHSDLPTRLARVLDIAIEVTKAERGFIMLREDRTGALRVHVARKMGQDLQVGSPSMGIAGKAAQTGKPVLMKNVMQDQELAQRESIIRQRISSAMCAPLIVEDRILGSIYVDSRQPGFSFTEQDLELFASVASQSALAIENVRLYQQMLETDRKRAMLSRFLSPSVVEAMMMEDIDPVLGGKKQIVTTLFCDIRGFTTIAERMPPIELLTLLNEHFTAMVDVIFSQQGTLDKFIGDEIMAVFGAPIAHCDDPERAVFSAIEMQRKNCELNEKRAIRGSPTFEIGVGIGSGEVIAGLLGSPQRMDFTVIGDRVNVARRLCSMAEGGQIIVCELTYEIVKNKVHSRRIGTVALRGKEIPVRAFEIMWRE